MASTSCELPYDDTVGAPQPAPAWQHRGAAQRRSQRQSERGVSRKVADSGGGRESTIRWYRRRALAWLPQRIHPWSQRMGVRQHQLDMRDLGYRWGSLGKRDRLNLH
ncbi:MAG: YgjP-like metallopeptidase domain-containing protein [Pseudonocardiaceae bacterium]